jgi:hypothetical protein
MEERLGPPGMQKAGGGDYTAARLMVVPGKQPI